MYNEVVNSLTQFGLKKNHAKLLNFFLRNIGKEFTARDISPQVNIPVSRIYIYLNDLVKFKLLDRSFRNKALFSLTEPESKFREFLNRRDRETKELQRGILDGLRSFAGENFVVIKSPEEFYEIAYGIVKDAKKVKILSKSPFMIANQESEYWGKQFLDTFNTKISNNGLEFSYVFDKNFLKDKQLSNKEALIENIIKLSGSKNVNLRTVKGHNVLTMLNMVITEKEVLVGFSTVEERKIVRGLLLRSEDMAGFFEKIYDEVFKAAEKIDIRYLNALSASLKLIKRFTIKRTANIGLKKNVK